MKKKFLFTVTSIIAAITLFVAGVYAASDIRLIINGKNVASDIQVIDGSSYVPLRVVSESLGANIVWDDNTRTITITGKDYEASEVSLHFPADKYPETARHIKNAIAKGESAICTIDRDGADKNREESLQSIPTKDGYDRDEWPMAMCAEGGAGADIEYITPADNRGAGSWVSNQLENYADGTKVLFIVDDVAATSEQTPAQKPVEQAAEPKYNSCAEVKAAGKAPIHVGDPGYSTKLDRDGDGIACEK